MAILAYVGYQLYYYNTFVEQQARRIIGHVYNADNSAAATGNRVSVT